jgi:hypothetical protein
LIVPFIDAAIPFLRENVERTASICRAEILRMDEMFFFATSAVGVPVALGRA